MSFLDLGVGHCSMACVFVRDYGHNGASDDESEVVNFLSAKAALRQFRVQLLFSYVVEMIFPGVAVNEDVIQVHYNELVEVLREGFIHGRHECCRGIS